MALQCSTRVWIDPGYVQCSRAAAWRRHGDGYPICDEHLQESIAWWRERNYDLAADYELIPLPPPVEVAPSTAQPVAPPDLVSPEARFATHMRRRRMWAAASDQYVEVLELLVVCERCGTEIVNSHMIGPTLRDGVPSVVYSTNKGNSVLEAQVVHYNACAGEPK